MVQEILKLAEKHNLATKKLADFKVGDTLSVSMRIREGAKERIQAFAGTVIQIRGAGLGKTFTVRKSSNGVFVERIFPFNSPLISEVKKTRSGKVRRAKIFYIREQIGKSARIKEDK